ncbi:MAG: ABC transporter permease [Firmicutes bacterium]|nr:ABC transporter permease [Bacillota bacterium]
MRRSLANGPHTPGAGYRLGVTQFLVDYNLYLILGILLIVSSLVSKQFFTANNLMNLLLRSSFNGLISLGMTFVILTGCTDLSVGSTFAFAGVFLATLQRGYYFRFMPQLTHAFEQAGELNPILPLPAALALTVAVGGVIGLVNGLLVTKARIPAFAATLGTMVAVRGLAFTYAGGFPIPGLTDGVKWLGAGQVGLVPVPVIVWAIGILVSWTTLKYTVFGRRVYAVGGGERAARLSGIDVDRTKITVFVVSGMLAALSGAIMAGRMNAAEPREGAGYELDAIAAVVIGGTLLSGGKGGVLGTVAGAIVLGLISNILNLANVAPYPQQIAKGLIILGSVVMQRFVGRK